MKSSISIILVLLLAFNVQSIEFVDECPEILQGQQPQPNPLDDTIYLKKGCDWVGIGSCSSSLQSPINIDSQADPNCQNIQTDGLSFQWQIDNQEVQLKFEKANGQLKTAWPQDGEQIPVFHYKTGEVDHIFKLQLISVHTFAEHRIDSKKYDAEVQFQFQLAEGQSQEGLTNAAGNVRNLAIVSFLFEMNNGKGDFFAPGNWDLSKASSGEAFPFNFATAFSGISPNSLNFFHYFGSQTTPNCEENVNWFVIGDSFKIKDNDLFTLSGLFSDPSKFPYGNLRVLQPTNDRKIYQGNCNVPLAVQGSF